MADGVIVVDTTGKINLINPAAADMAGWPVNEATNLNVNSIIKLAQENGKDLDEVNNPFTTVMRDKQAFKNTLQIISKDKSSHVISLVVTPLVVPPNYELVGAVARYAWY